MSAACPIAAKPMSRLRKDGYDAGAAAGLIGGRRRIHAPDQLEWHCKTGADEIAVFSARLTQVDASHTRVKVEFEVGAALDPQAGQLVSIGLIRSTARPPSR